MADVGLSAAFRAELRALLQHRATLGAVHRHRKHGGGERWRPGEWRRHLGSRIGQGRWRGAATLRTEFGTLLERRSAFEARGHGLDGFSLAIPSQSWLEGLQTLAK